VYYATCAPHVRNMLHTVYNVFSHVRNVIRIRIIIDDNLQLNHSDCLIADSIVLGIFRIIFDTALHVYFCLFKIPKEKRADRR
jgi:hypothetical protein